MQDSLIIPFTQYLLPNGRRINVEFTGATQESFDKAQLIMEATFRFEIEVLNNGMVSATISDHNDDYAQVICANGPEIDDAINKMIIDFDIETATKLAAERANLNSDTVNGDEDDND